MLKRVFVLNTSWSGPVQLCAGLNFWHAHDCAVLKLILLLVGCEGRNPSPNAILVDVGLETRDETRRCSARYAASVTVEVGGAAQWSIW